MIQLCCSRLFSDGQICEAFTMAQQKVSYILQDGIGPLLEEEICESVSDS